MSESQNKLKVPTDPGSQSDLATRISESNLDDKSCVTFTCDNKVFPVSDETTTVYYDEGMQQVLVVRWKANYAMVYLMSFTRQGEELVFRLPDTEIINSIKLSEDLRVAAVHRSMCVVDFFDPDDDTGPIHALGGRYANSKILRFYWLHTRDFVLITENSVELHQLSADGRNSKLVKYYGLTLDWSVFSHSAQFLVVCSGSHPSLHTYSFQTEGTVTRLSRVDCLSNYQTSGSIHEHLSERDISIFHIYDQLYVTRVRNQVQRGNQHGMEVDMFRVTKEAALKEYVLYWNLAPQVNTARVFALTSHDNHIIVHHQASKTCAVFDILHSEVDLTVRTSVDSTAADSRPFTPLSRSPSALHSRRPSNMGVTPRIRSSSSSRVLVTNTVKFVYPLVKGQSPHAAAGQTLPAKVYSGGWALFQPNIGLDAQQGRLWRISVCVESVCASVAEAAERVDYLLRRSTSKGLLINCVQDCFSAECLEQPSAHGKLSSAKLDNPIPDQVPSRSPSGSKVTAQPSITLPNTSPVAKRPSKITPATRREHIMELLVLSLGKWQTQEAARQCQQQQLRSPSGFRSSSVATYSKPAPGGYSALPWQTVASMSRSRRSTIHVSSPGSRRLSRSPRVSPRGVSPKLTFRDRSSSRSRFRTTSEDLTPSSADTNPNAQSSEVNNPSDCLYVEDSHGTQTAELLLERLQRASFAQKAQRRSNSVVVQAPSDCATDTHSRTLPEGMSQERRSCELCCRRLGLASDTSCGIDDKQKRECSIESPVNLPEDGSSNPQGGCKRQTCTRSHTPAMAHTGTCSEECDSTSAVEHSIAQQAIAESRVIPVMLQMDMLVHVFRPLVRTITMRNRKRRGKRLIHLFFQFRRALVCHGVTPLAELDAEICSLLIRLCQVQRLKTVLRSGLIRPCRLVLWTMLTTPLNEDWTSHGDQLSYCDCKTLESDKLEVQTTTLPARFEEQHPDSLTGNCTCILHRDLNGSNQEPFRFGIAELLLNLKNTRRIAQYLHSQHQHQQSPLGNAIIILEAVARDPNPLRLYNIIDYYERCRNKLQAKLDTLQIDKGSSELPDLAFDQYKSLARDRCACLEDG